MACVLFFCGNSGLKRGDRDCWKLRTDLAVFGRSELRQPPGNVTPWHDGDRTISVLSLSLSR